MSRRGSSGRAAIIILVIFIDDSSMSVVNVVITIFIRFIFVLFTVFVVTYDGGGSVSREDPLALPPCETSEPAIPPAQRLKL